MYKWITVALLLCSNTFMTFAWYAHLKEFKSKPIYYVILISWSIAFIEYCFSIPANRIGYLKGGFNLMQLKIIQEVITLLVFIPFATLFMEQKMNLNYLWAAISQEKCNLTLHKKGHC